MVIPKILPAVISMPVLEDNNVGRNECFNSLQVMPLKRSLKLADGIANFSF